MLNHFLLDIHSRCKNSRVPLSRSLFHNIIFFVTAKTFSKAEKPLYLNLEGRRSIRRAYKIYLTDMTGKQATFCLKCVYIVEKQFCKNVRTSFSTSSGLRPLPFNKTWPPNSSEATFLPAFPHGRLQISENLMGKLSHTSRLLSPLIAQNAMLVQGHVKLKPRYEWYNAKDLVGTNLLYFSLKAFLVACQSCRSVCTDADAFCRKKCVLLWHSHSVP
jgi:hypothetical protein